MKNPVFRVENESDEEVSIVCWSPEFATISADQKPSVAVAITKDMAKQIAEYLLSWVNSDGK